MNLNSVLIYVNICSTSKKNFHRQDKVNVDEEEREGEIELSALKSRSQSSSIVFLTVAVFYSFSVWLLAPSISLCFTFRFISVHALSAEPLVLVPSPHSLTLDPPQVPWMGLWRSWWSHTEDTGPLPQQAYRKCYLQGSWIIERQEWVATGMHV